jgi:hypothetical protein
MRTRLSVLVMFCAMIAAPGLALAHSGGLDSKGCHTNRKTGDYHCHRAQAPAGDSKDAASSAAPAVKKSKSDICHDRESPYYERTTNFTAFSSMAACLSSGGRRPK